MTDDKPGTGDADEQEQLSEDAESSEAASEETGEATNDAEGQSVADEASADDAASTDDTDTEGTDGAAEAESVDTSTGGDADTAEVGGDPDAEVAAGAAWTTTPVAPDPEATEAALAALAAAPEAPVEAAAPGMGVQSGGEEPPEEGTPVLLVGGILVGAFIVALGIVLLLFRPFDSVDVVGSPSPSPIVSSSPSAQPTDDLSVDTPDFQGLSLEEAEDEAAAQDLIVRIIPVETDEAEPDTVLDQDPAAGTILLAGDTVELEVAVPLSPMPVPDPIGLEEDDFLAALDDAGLVPGERTEASDSDIPAGEIISTNPDAGTEMAQGSAVAYVVSSGPASVSVPDVIDTSEADALAAFDDADLVPGERTVAADELIVAGNIISTDPAAADEVAPGSGVAYVVSKGLPLVEVPTLDGGSSADAEQALTEVGLSGND
jgi:beta-lactam-binding protein with PASTA domain